MPDNDHIERITRLETKVDTAIQTLGSNSGLFAQIQSTLQQIGQTLAVIVSKQDDYKDYQKTCEAERRAQDIRLASLENDRNASEMRQKTERKTFFQVISAQAGLVALILSVLTFCFSFLKH